MHAMFRASRIMAGRSLFINSLLISIRFPSTEGIYQTQIRCNWQELTVAVKTIEHCHYLNDLTPVCAIRTPLPCTCPASVTVTRQQLQPTHPYHPDHNAPKTQASVCIYACVCVCACALVFAVFWVTLTPLAKWGNFFAEWSHFRLTRLKPKLGWGKGRRTAWNLDSWQAKWVRLAELKHFWAGGSCEETWFSTLLPDTHKHFIKTWRWTALTLKLQMADVSERILLLGSAGIMWSVCWFVHLS